MNEAELREQIFNLVWTPPSSCRNVDTGAVNYHLLTNQILALLPQYEPVQLKELSASQMADIIGNPRNYGSLVIYRSEYPQYITRISQATIAHNEAKGQLYRIKK